MTSAAFVPASDSDRWVSLRDATLVDLHIDWASGALNITLRAAGTDAPARVEATKLVALRCPRRFPWGTSLQINEVHPPVQTNEGVKLEIEMQSGDMLMVLAHSLALQTAPS